ncbi:MAG: DUF5011 domain-containing protein [Bacteroidia bacterium]
MKKNIALMLTLLFTSSTLLFTGCKKDDEDTVPPVVTLLGNNPEYVQVNKTYTDAGATATDDIDGTLSAPASGTVNTSVVGTYTITYTATDREGNVGTAARTVHVVNFDGTYDGNEICDVTGSNPGTITVEASTVTANNGMTIENFAFAGNNVVANATFSGNKLTIPSQTIGSSTYSGTGTISGVGTTANPLVFNITYLTTVGSVSQTCQATFTKN